MGGRPGPIQNREDFEISEAKIDECCFPLTFFDNKILYSL